MEEKVEYIEEKIKRACCTEVCGSQLRPPACSDVAHGVLVASLLTLIISSSIGQEVGSVLTGAK